MEDFEMRETFICPYHFATNVDAFNFLANSPDRYQTSLSIYKRAQLCVNVMWSHRNSYAFSSWAEITQRCLSQQVRLRTGFSICPIRNSLERNVQTAN